MARPDRAATDDVPGLAARRVAAEIIDGVLRRHRALDEQLDGAGANAGLSGLADRDRALTRALVAAVLRRLGSLRHLIGLFLEHGVPAKAPRVETALLIGAAQILFLDVPDHAAVDLAVRLVRADHNAHYFAGLVNAILRRIAREGPERLAAFDPAARCAGVADGALDQNLRRGDRAGHRAGASQRAGAGSHRQKRSRGLGRAARRPGAADRIGTHDGAWAGQRAAGFRRGRVVGAGCGGGTSGAPPRRGRRPSCRRSLRGARRQNRAARGGGRTRHRGRPLAGAACPPARKSRAAFARRRSGQRRCRGMECRTVRRRAARRAVLVHRHHPPPSRHSVAQDRSRHHEARRLAATPDRSRGDARRGRAARWSIAPARSNPRKARTSSQACSRASPACSARRSTRRRYPGGASS